MMGSILAPKWETESDQTLCQAIVLLFCSLFPKSHRVRHRFINKIKYFFDYMMDSFEKHWRACKRGALPN